MPEKVPGVIAVVDERMLSAIKTRSVGEGETVFPVVILMDSDPRVVFLFETVKICPGNVRAYPTILIRAGLYPDCPSSAVCRKNQRLCGLGLRKLRLSS